MPIMIQEKPEPLSEASRGETKPDLIDSDAFRLLRHELRRYCKQEVTGRSFLVAGHRGSGKTTLVHGAFQQVLEEVAEAGPSGAFQQVLEEVAEAGPSPEINNRWLLRPLLVVLQGPNLLPSPMESETIAPASTKTANEVAATVAQAGEMENVLIQITLGLYRALAKEFTRSFRDRIANSPSWSIPLQRGRLELAAQFELELDEYPGKMRLRDYWRRGGFLETGVLFPTEFDHYYRPYIPIQMSLPGSYWARFKIKISRPFDQGLRELVALSTACEAYRRICGTINRKEENKAGTQMKAEAQIAADAKGVDAKGTDLMKPVIALLIGGLAGSGVLAANPSASVTATLAGLLAALAASVVLKYSASWSRQRSLSREDLFIPNLSVATLDRVLPVLIERIRAAGLAPVFVVDELDKVVWLSDRITEMVRRLKKFVAENAFFCFLADRTYFEEMRERTADKPYPPEYTYFTNQVFVVFKHQDLHQYLERVLKRPPPIPESPEDGMDEDTTEGVVMEPVVTDLETSEYSADYPVLPYILLHASQMHPIDLRRQLLAIRNSQGEVSLEPGAVRSRPRYRFELMIQVAIEVVLEEADMQAELERQPAFLRLAHDALYYISWCWGDAPKHLVLDTEGERVFEAYLRARIVSDTPPREFQQADREPGNDQRSAVDKQLAAIQWHSKRSHIEPAHQRFLIECVRELADLLASPPRLRERAKARGMSQQVQDALPSEPLLKPVEGKEHVYQWYCYQSGRTIEHEGAAEKRPEHVLPETAWKENADFIEEFERKLTELTRGSVEPSVLSSQFGIISTTPAWADVKRALARLRAAQGTGLAYPEQDADVSVLKSFRSLLQCSGRTVALALLCGEVIGSWSPRRDTQGSLPGLKAVSDAFWFRNMAAEHVTENLRDLVTQICETFKLTDDFKNPPELLSMENLTDWAKWVAEAYRAVLDKIGQKEDVLRESQRIAWQSWFNRLQGDTVQQSKRLLSEMICMAARAGPARYLEYDFNSMTLGRWSEALRGALVSKESEDHRYAPPWLALAALEHLGFEYQVHKFVANLAEPSGREQLFGKRHISDEETQDLRKWRRPKLRGHRRSALIVSKLRRPVVSGWRPSELYAAIVLRADSVAKLVELWKPVGPSVLKFLALDFVAFEMPDEQFPDDEQSSDIIKFFSSGKEGRVILVFPELPRRFYMPTSYSAITARNLEEIFRAEQPEDI